MSETQSLAGRVLMAISGVCDGARTEDGAGFSGFDAQCGKSLAQSFFDRGHWQSVKQFNLAKKLAIKYRRQAVEFGFVEADIKAEEYAGVQRAAGEAAVTKAPPAEAYVIGYVIRSTAKAIQFQPRAGMRVWLPTSQILAREAIDGSSTDCVLRMPAWLAHRAGLESNGPAAEVAG